MKAAVQLLVLDTLLEFCCIYYDPEVLCDPSLSALLFGLVAGVSVLDLLVEMVAAIALGSVCCLLVDIDDQACEVEIKELFWLTATLWFLLRIVTTLRL
jgi:hypothetical protein